MLEDYSKLKDKDLIRKIQTRSDGYEWAWKILIDRYRGGIYSECYGILKPPYFDTDDIEDVVEETFIEMFSKIDRVDVDRPLFAWLRILARNNCIDKWRTKNRNKDRQGKLPKFQVKTPEEVYKTTVIYECMNRLEDVEREIINRHCSLAITKN